MGSTLLAGVCTRMYGWAGGDSGEVSGQGRKSLPARKFYISFSLTWCGLVSSTWW